MNSCLSLLEFWGYGCCPTHDYTRCFQKEDSLAVLRISTWCFRADWLTSPCPPPQHPSPVLQLLAQVVKALAKLVHLSLLALQVRAVLLEAAGQRIRALLGCLQVLFYLAQEELLGLQLRSHGLWKETTLLWSELPAAREHCPEHWVTCIGRHQARSTMNALCLCAYQTWSFCSALLLQKHNSKKFTSKIL